MITQKEILEKLKTVLDPEVHIDIVTMGLIYDIHIDADESVVVTMTYTTPFCPMGPQITQSVKDAISTLGISQMNISVDVTFDPPWEAPHDLRTAIGI